MVEASNGTRRWRIGELLADPIVTGALLTEGLPSNPVRGLEALAVRLEAGGRWALAVQARRMVNRARLLPAGARVTVELRPAR